MNMRTIWRIQANMRNQEYDLPGRVLKTSYWWYYTPDHVRGSPLAVIMGLDAVGQRIPR